MKNVQVCQHGGVVIIAATLQRHDVGLRFLGRFGQLSAAIAMVRNMKM